MVCLALAARCGYIFDDPTGLASTSSYGWHCSDVDGALRKLQMLALIGREDVCLGSPVGVGLGRDFKTREGATKIWVYSPS